MVYSYSPPSQYSVNNGGVFCGPPPEEETFEILNNCAAGFNVRFGERTEKCALTGMAEEVGAGNQVTKSLSGVCGQM